MHITNDHVGAMPLLLLVHARRRPQAGVVLLGGMTDADEEGSPSAAALEKEVEHGGGEPPLPNPQGPGEGANGVGGGASNDDDDDFDDCLEEDELHNRYVDYSCATGWEYFINDIEEVGVHETAPCCIISIYSVLLQ